MGLTQEASVDGVLREVPPPGYYADDLVWMPEGSVVDGSGLVRLHADAADYVVIGSGAAGGAVAWSLAERGKSVIVVEEGPWVRTRDFKPEMRHAFRNLYRWGGMGFVTGRAFLPLLQGMCVGGTTTINSAIVWRLPLDVYADWERNYGIGSTINQEAVEPCMDRLENLLNVHAVDGDVLGKNSMIMRDGMVKLGIKPHTIVRNERGCLGSSRCSQGCPHGAKLSTALTCIPWTLERGGRIYTNTRVGRVRITGGVATGVEATTGAGGKLTIIARQGVVVAASTIQTPNILRRSGLRARALGRNLMMHPGVGMAALYDDDVCMHRGVTQGMETLSFRLTDRFKLESLALSPELAAVRIPGIGASFVRGLSDYRKIALWGVQVRARAVGTVGSFAGDDVVRYTLLPGDLRIGKRGLKVLAEIAFATGAREVWPGIFGMPDVLRSPDDLRIIDEVPDDPRLFMYIASHMFGAARMGPDPRDSVVGLDFSTHEVKRLFVVDSSLFPTNLGVNPQHPIMGIAMVASERIAG